jgi:hypothetical protein
MMTEEYNPFTDCEAYVSEHGTGAGVHSKYWNIPMPNEGVAKRVAELIRFAYYRGVSDNQDAIKKVLGIKE